MPIHLYLAPAGAGKTDYLLSQVRQTTRAGLSSARVCVASTLQAAAWKNRLAGQGGSLGTRVQIFDELYLDCLNAAGVPFTELSEPVRRRLVQVIAESLPLRHFAPIAHRPGFVQLLQGFIAELKAARIDPDQLAAAIARFSTEPRLTEPAQIYATYQTQLQSLNWADRAGLGWLAVQTLETESDPPQAGPILLVDGFDNFTGVQIAFLRAYSRRFEQTIIALTGTTDGSERLFAHRRFDQTRRRMEEAFGCTAEPLPVAQSSRRRAVFTHLERSLFESAAPQISQNKEVELIAAPDLPGEVRAALRRLKQRVVLDGVSPADTALLARDMSPYRPFIEQVGREFGLPLRFVDGAPLKENPAVAALLNLLRLSLPASGTAEPAFPRREVVTAWASPYFDWIALTGIRPGDANALDALARAGRVTGGRAQWRETLLALSTRTAEAPADGDEAVAIEITAAAELRDKFERFTACLTPPAQTATFRDFTAWLEDLIGAEAEAGSGLNMVACIQAEPATCARDLSALRALKEVLRGLVWAEQAVTPGRAVPFTTFCAELFGAVEGASYQPAPPAGAAILVADVVQVRGLSFDTAAVLGLAEGVFPATRGEDTLLRDADREQLGQSGFRLDRSTDSPEAEFFYETVNRARERLIFTRPRLTDTGAVWPASPFWDEIAKLVAVTPLTLTGDSLPAPAEAASPAEFLSAATHAAAFPAEDAAIEAAVRLLKARRAGSTGSPFDGDLSELGPDFAARFGPAYGWSVSKLETYRACPLRFFVTYVLNLQPKTEPTEGLEAWQLGNIYHHIFETVYKTTGNSTDLPTLLAALPGVAKAVLDAAPEKEGFRVTAWWEQTRQEIIANVEASLVKLAETAGAFKPVHHEYRFFGSQTATISGENGDFFKLHGVIDRIDAAPDGTLRIIDYKTAGPTGYTNKTLLDGKKIQLPLYAPAIEQALKQKVVDGFYWHVRHAEPSPFTLAKFGPENPVETAVAHAWEAVRGARAGRFVPTPPGDGCPDYCAAALFCAHYHSGFGG